MDAAGKPAGKPGAFADLRVAIGEGNDADIRAVALSPDGKWVAAGGWDARYSIDKTMSVYIFEAATARLSPASAALAM